MQNAIKSLKILEYYFKTDSEWRLWLHENHDTTNGIYLIFFKVENKEASMRGEEAVKVALCYGWMDSTVKSLGNGKRRQYFCPRISKSVWSALNKRYIIELKKEKLMHHCGLKTIKTPKQNGRWAALDHVEKGIIPKDLQNAFDSHPKALSHYKNCALLQKKLFVLVTSSQASSSAKQTNHRDSQIVLCKY